MENNTKKSPTKQELEKLPVKDQMYYGLAIGSQLVESWKKKGLTLIARIIVIGIILFIIWKILKMNGVI